MSAIVEIYLLCKNDIKCFFFHIVVLMIKCIKGKLCYRFRVKDITQKWPYGKFVI